LVVVFGAQHHDGAGGVEVDDLQVGVLDGVAGAADDAGVAAIQPTQPRSTLGGVLDRAHLFTDGTLHLHLVLIAQDHDTGIALVGVGDDQLGNDGKHLLIPAQDDGVAVLDDARAPALERLHPVLDAGIEHTDEDAHPEQAAQGDHQHDQQVFRGIVGIHRVGGQRLGQNVPKDRSRAEIFGQCVQD
jgi:hypothetical protein